MSGLAVLNAGFAGLGNAGVMLKSKRDYEQETARFDTEHKQREANLEGTQLANQEFDYTKLDPARIQHQRRVDEEAATDLHLHAKIRDRESLPNMTQVDFSAPLDLLLSEIERISRG